MSRTAQLARVMAHVEDTDPRIRWFAGQVEDFGRRTVEHQARIDAAIAKVEAALADYRMDRA